MDNFWRVLGFFLAAVMVAIGIVIERFSLLGGLCLLTIIAIVVFFLKLEDVKHE